MCVRAPRREAPRKPGVASDEEMAAFMIGNDWESGTTMVVVVDARNPAAEDDCASAEKSGGGRAYPPHCAAVLVPACLAVAWSHVCFASSRQAQSPVSRRSSRARRLCA